MCKMSLNFSRQTKLVPTEEINQYKIKVFGVGSVGSYVTKLLAKVGFNKIEVYDMDIVEEENLSAQAFDFRHLKKTKVDAMKEIVKECAGIDIKTHHGQITKDTPIEGEPNTIYCCFFDSFEARQLVFDFIKPLPTIFVDARIGGYNMRHYFVECSNQKDKEDYESTLNTGASSELGCGEKANAMINMQIAGKIVANIVNFIRGQRYVKRYLGNIEDPKNDIVVYNERGKQNDATSEQDL